MTKYNCIDALIKAGISYQDATALRRISMTLHRWHELECGDGNNHGSWCITRGRKVKLLKDHIPTLKDSRETFVHDDDGKPYLEHHHYLHGQGKDYITYSALPDRERGAMKRLAKIMANYPGWASYVQGDPRGCALYILSATLMCEIAGLGDVSSYYNRGIAVYK